MEEEGYGYNRAGKSKDKATIGQGKAKIELVCDMEEKGQCYNNRTGTVRTK